MPRQKQDKVPFSLRIDRALLERLEQYCDDAGQTKTTAVERALTMYMDDWDSKKKKLEQ